MAALGGTNQIARRVIDDLIEFSRETYVDGYMSFFKSQQISESRGFINRQREEANTARNLVTLLNALIAEMEALKDQREIFDTLMDLRNDREAAQIKMQGLNELLTQAEQEIEKKEAQIQELVVVFEFKYALVMHYCRYGSILNTIQGRNELLEKIIGCVVDSGGVLELDPKVNYDNDNDIDNLGYESEVYLDDEEEEEEDENNHSNGNVVKRGITRLSKFHMEYGKPDGIKLSVTFDALNKISGSHKALFSSFLGDLVCEHIGLKILSWKKVGSEARDKLWDEITRYFDVDLTVRKLVMNRLGQLLRNFRRKLRQTYILPNQNTLSKLNEVPAKYSAILKAEEWVNFVKYTTTEEYKVKSAAAKMARSKSVYQHTMGRGGYAHVKEKMIENKEIKPDEEPPRGIMWLKGRVNKDGQFPNDEIRSVGDKHRYFDLPRSRQASDERIALLESQLDNERREREEKELEIQNLSNKMSETEGMVSPVDINPIDNNADEEGGTPLSVVGCENDASIQKSNGLATSKKEMETRETVNSVGSKKTTKSLRKESSRQRSQSQEDVSPLLVLPQSCGSCVVGHSVVMMSLLGSIKISNKACGRIWLCHSPESGWINLLIREDRPVIRISILAVPISNDLQAEQYDKMNLC
ncbi:transposase, Ptta/En/Spm, transposase, Tnp1/En/Spm-like protein [Tanacetum coccineum]